MARTSEKLGSGGEEPPHPIESPVGKPSDGGAPPVGAARAWTYVGLGFLGVFAVAVLLFAGHQRRREGELERLYTRAAARLGAQVELRYKSYSELAENVTQVLHSAQPSSEDAFQESLSSAQATLEDAAERTAQARQRTEAARRMKELVAQASSEASAKPAKASLAEELRGPSAAVEAWLQLSRESERRDQVRGQAAERVLAAESAFRRAVERLAQAKTSQTREGAESAARSELEWAEANLARALETLREERNAADRAWLRALEAGDAAERAWGAAAPALALQSAERPTREHSAAAPAPAPVTAKDAIESMSAARTFRERVSQLVLPSYRSSIAECPTSSGLTVTMLCAAGKLAELSGGDSGREKGFEFVECPARDEKDAPDAPKPADERFLYLPTSSPPKLPGSLCARIRLSRLLPEREASTPIEFEAVALFRRDGSALYTRELESLVAREFFGVRIAKLPKLAESNFLASATSKDVVLGGQSYRVYTQPVRIKLGLGDEAASPGVRSDLIFAGFVPEPALLRASREISLDSYVWVLLLLGLGLLSLPLAKLWLLGPNSQLKRFDVTMLATSAGVMTLFSAVLLMSFVAHNRLDTRSDQQAKKVAEWLARHLKDHITEAGAVLRVFSERTPKGLMDAVATTNGAVERYRLAEACAGDARGELLDRARFHDAPGRWVVCELTHFELPSVRSPWNLAFLSNTRGFQAAKFTPGAHASTPISVAHRDYFKDALADRTACTNPSCSERAAVEVVRSATKGSLVMLLAKRLPSGNGVAALEAPLDGSQSLVLPLGFQALVIDRDGRILLHSHDERAHSQALFADVDKPTELRAALVNQTSESIDLGYLGVPSHLRIEPLGLADLGWSTVVIRPRGVVDVAATDMLLITLFALGALILFAIASACLLLFCKRVAWVMALGQYFSPRGPREDDEGGARLRPRLGRSGDYARAGMLMLNLSLFLVLLALFGTDRLLPTWLLFSALLLGWFALREIPGLDRPLPLFAKETSAFVRKLRGSRAWQALRKESAYWSPGPDPKWRNDPRVTYTLCAIGVAALFIVTPASIVFASAYRHVVETLIRAECYDFASKLRGRPVCPERDDRNVPNCALVVPAAVEEYVPSAELPRAEPVSCWFTPLNCLADRLPPLGSKETQHFGRLYRVGRGAHDPASGRWARSSSETGLGWPERARPSVSLPTLFSTSFQWRPLAALALIFGTFFAVSTAAAHASLNRIFFIDVLRLAKRSLADPPLYPSHLPEGSKTLLLCDESSTMRGAQALALSERLRGQGFEELPQLQRSKRSEEEGTQRYFCRIEPGLEDGSVLERVTAAGASRATVVLLSSIDPMRRVSDAMRAAWSVALSPFSVVALDRPMSPPEKATLAGMTAVWESCDAREQRALAQLAFQGFTNPHERNRSTVEHLILRGILSRDTLAIANPRFGAFLRESVSAEQLRQWDAADQGSAWHALRVPLSTAVIALFGTITVSKPELGVASALVPTLATSLPFVLKSVLQLLEKRA